MKKKLQVIGLTGGPATGKSTLARMFIKNGAVLFCADQAVRELLSQDKKTAQFFKKNYPEVFCGGRISRKRVGQILFSAPEIRKEIENFLHPLVYEQAQKAIKHAIKQKKAFLVLDVPLLYEAGFEVLCDIVCSTKVSRKKQMERFLERGRMTEAQFKAILKRQLPESAKRKKADHIFNTDLSLKETEKKVEAFLKK